MKSIIIFIAIFSLGLGQAAAAVEFKCPQPYLSELKPLTLSKYLGTWFSIRGTPCGEGPDAACVATTLYRTKDSPENSVKCVVSVQTNGTTEYMEGNSIATPSKDEPGKVDNHFTYDMMNVTMTSVFVASDDGQSWAIEHVCFEMMGNLTSMWNVLGRNRQMDAKLEQDLVEKIEKWSGVTQDKIRGIRQTDCYA